MVPRPTRRRLGDVLIERNLLTIAQLDEALTAQQHLTGKDRRRLGQLIVEMGLVTERQLAESLAELLSLELIDNTNLTIPTDVARLLPRQVAERARVLVVGRTEDGGLRIATADPTNVVALDDVRAYTGSQQLTLVVATETMIREHIARIYSMGNDAETIDEIPDFSAEKEIEADMLAAAADQAPTVRLVNQLLSDGVRVGASDIHVEPQADGVYIRHRIDGVLRDITRVPKSAVAALTSRLKIVASMDIAERRLPQDGRMKVTANGVSVDARVSSLPSMHGEKIVIRLLPEAKQITPVTAMGMEPDQLAALLQSAVSSQGLILITGPTGSGKTNTLYSVLNDVATREKNVITLEDPVEIQLPGITQVQTNERAGLTFARGLRSILRQDPDVLLVGEVRDGETAALALEASLTGHLVLTTLHTNNAASAVTRLVDMGAEPYLVASSLTLVVAQRLVRRPCANCAVAYQPDPKLLARLGVTAEMLATATPKRGDGCTECNDTGYRGRTGIFEVLKVSEAVRDVLLTNPTERNVSMAADAEGMRSLRDAAITKALAGETTFEEVVRVTDDTRKRVERRRDLAGDELAEVVAAAAVVEVVEAPVVVTKFAPIVAPPVVTSAPVVTAVSVGAQKAAPGAFALVAPEAPRVARAVTAENLAERNPAAVNPFAELPAADTAVPKVAEPRVDRRRSELHVAAIVEPAPVVEAAPVKRGPGRPRKVVAAPVPVVQAPPTDVAPAVKRGPGRPRKVVAEVPVPAVPAATTEAAPAEAAPAVRRGPGRPRKVVADGPDAPPAEFTVPEVVLPKRRGRPLGSKNVPKNPDLKATGT
jgi:type IV pilus assembly protein PilB